MEDTSGLAVARSAAAPTVTGVASSSGVANDGNEVVVADDQATPPSDVGASSSSPRGSSTWGRLRAGLLGRGAISLLVATAGVNVSNFLFHVVLSRLLGPGHYGIVGAILSLISLLAIPIGAAQLAVTQAVIDDVKRGGTFHLARVLRTAVIGGLAGLVAFAALTPVFDGFLHTSSPVPLLLVSLWIPLATVGAVLQGALIGEYRFRSVAFASFVGGGPVRLALGAVVALAGFGVEGAITATVAAQLFTTASLLVSARRRVATQQRVATRAKRGDIALSVGALSGYTALIGIDTFLSRHFLLANAAGYYAAAAVAAHIALFVPGAIVMVAFPHLVDGRGASAASRRIFVEAMAVTVVLGVAVAGAMSLLSGFTIAVLFGSHYRPAVDLLAPLAVASVGFGAMSALVYFQLARRSRWALTPWFGVVAAAILIWADHSSALAIAMIMLVVSGLTTLLTAVPVAQSLLAGAAVDAAGKMRWFDLPPQELDLTLVIPFYNPGPRLVVHVNEVLEVLEGSGLSFEVLAVSDGCTDHSEELLANHSSGRLQLVCLPKNQGKGAALREGLARGRGEYLGFIDGDGDIPAESLRHFLDVINYRKPDVIYASKRHPHSEVIYPPLRRLYSWGYQKLNRLLFHLPVRDTQTGAKFIRRDALAVVLPRMVEKRFAFDLELFVVAQENEFAEFVEVPVTIRERFTSTVSWRSVRATLVDTLAIFYRVRLLHFYDRETEPTSPDLQLPVGSPDPQIEAGVTPAVIALNVDEGRPRSMRILVFNWRDLTHPKAGGAEVYTHRVAEEWVKEGHHVTLFCAAVEGQPEAEEVRGVQIIRRGSRYSVYREGREYYRCEGRGYFDLVIDEINTRPFFAQKWVDDAPVVALAHQVCRELWFYQTPWPVALVGRYLLEPYWLRQYGDVPMITVSESSRLSLEQYGVRHVAVVPQGCDELYTFRNVPREAAPTVVFVGRLEAHKRPDHAIKSFQLLHDQIPEAKMWVIGSGPMAKKLQKTAPTGVEFLGRLSNHEKMSYLARAHVLIATSIREGWGLIVTEAASVGTPTIAYEVDGLRDSVRAHKGILTSAKPRDLFNVLWDYFSQAYVTTQVESYDSAGLKSWNDVAKTLLETFRKMIVSEENDSMDRNWSMKT